MQLVYRDLKKYKHQTLEPFEIEVELPSVGGNEYVWIQSGFLHIEPMYAWDGASGGIDTKDFRAASLVHDCLYQLIREGFLKLEHREYADDLLRKICLQQGMWSFRAWYVWKTVRMFGEKAAMPRKTESEKIIIEV